MSNDLTPDQAAFRQFELDGWKTSAPVYFDAIVGVNSQSVPALLDAAGVAAGVRVLDLACGPGHIAAAAAQRGAQVTGVDFSPQMLAQARRRYPDIAFQAGDAEALPLADASVDAVVMGYALFHFARPERALAECARVLRPGGRVAFTAWALPVPGSALAIANACLKAHATLDLGLPEGTPFHRFSEPDECRRVLTAAGFVDVGFRIVPQCWPMAAADDLYEGLSRASVRMKTVFQRQTPDVQQRLRAAMRQAVEAHATDDGYVLQMPAALSWAQKPA